MAASAHLDGRLHLLGAQRTPEAHAMPPQARGLRVEVVDLDGDVVEPHLLTRRQAVARLVEAQQLEPPGAEPEERRGEAELAAGSPRPRTFVANAEARSRSSTRMPT